MSLRCLVRMCLGGRQASERSLALVSRSEPPLLKIEVVNSSKMGDKLEVETGLQDIDVGRDADVIGGEATQRRRAEQRARIGVTESVIVVFDKAGKPVQEGVFTANA